MGSTLQSRKPPGLSPQVSSGYQHLFGGLGFVILVLILKEPAPVPITEAWLALGYLIVFGSIIAFTAFVQALRLLPMSVVFTYGYVNPVIAVVAGSLILKEPITLTTIAGAALVFLGVAGVFRDKYAVQGKDVRQQSAQPSDALE